jgi:mercuric reductase
MNQKFDDVIIGRGAAAFSAAIKLTELSGGEDSIAMIGSGPIGGTCVNVGCVPSKYFLEASHSVYYPAHPSFRGVGRTYPKLEFGSMMQGLRDLVRQQRHDKYETVIDGYPNVTVFEGSARFLSAGRIEIVPSPTGDDGHEAVSLTADRILIATGSRPSAPPIEGLNTVSFLTSDSVWNLDEKPEELTVIGGGAIGLELGQAFSHFGTMVSVVESMPRIISQADGDISAALERRLEREGMKFYVKTRISRVSKKGDGQITELVTAAGKKEIHSDAILVATGRAPNTDALNLEAAGVQTDGRGFIRTDSSMRTTNPSIFAAGDCVSKKLMLETLAGREGVIAASNMMGKPMQIDYSSTPWAVFTNPQIAAVGLTEEEVTKLYGSCSVSTLSLDHVPKAGILKDTDGFIKLVANPSSRKIVGAQLLAPLSTEYILEAATAIKLGLTYDDIINTTHVFPTLAEGIKIAAQAFVRDVQTMSCCVE